MRVNKKDHLGKRQSFVWPKISAGYRRRAAIWFKIAVFEKIYAMERQEAGTAGI